MIYDREENRLSNITITVYANNMQKFKFFTNGKSLLFTRSSLSSEAHKRLFDAWKNILLRKELYLRKLWWMNFCMRGRAVLNKQKRLGKIVFILLHKFKPSVYKIQPEAFTTNVLKLEFQASLSPSWLVI